MLETFKDFVRFGEYVDSPYGIGKKFSGFEFEVKDTYSHPHTEYIGEVSRSTLTRKLQIRGSINRLMTKEEVENMIECLEMIKNELGEV